MYGRRSGKKTQRGKLVKGTGNTTKTKIRKKGEKKEVLSRVFVPRFGRGGSQNIVGKERTIVKEEKRP